MCQRTPVVSRLQSDGSEVVKLRLPMEGQTGGKFGLEKRIALDWAHAGRLERASKSAVVLRALLEFRERMETVREAIEGAARGRQRH